MHVNAWAYVSLGKCYAYRLIMLLAGAVQKDIDLQRVSKPKVCSGAWDKCYMNREPEKRTERKRPIC